MKKFEEDRNNFSLILECSFVLVLIIVIFAFQFSPLSNKPNKKIFQYHESVITLIDIPISKTEDFKNKTKSVPLVPSLEIDIDSEDELIVDLQMDEFEIVEESKTNSSNNIKTKLAQFVPKQVLEVFPDNENCVGEIILKIKIGLNGMVTDHKILSNSTESGECLKSVIEAVYKSRWKPVEIEGEKIIMWIDKTYNFEN
ncbi:MAG: hypothetical protein JEY94_02935 [Melioribacteraceae bacterium]|nr:hypothetical protein [Melioribacteraceae bacterium]